MAVWVPMLWGFQHASVNICASILGPFWATWLLFSKHVIRAGGIPSRWCLFLCGKWGFPSVSIRPMSLISSTPLPFRPRCTNNMVWPPTSCSCSQHRVSIWSICSLPNLWGRTSFGSWSEERADPKGTANTARYVDWCGWGYDMIWYDPSFLQFLPKFTHMRRFNSFNSSTPVVFRCVPLFQCHRSAIPGLARWHSRPEAVWLHRLFELGSWHLLPESLAWRVINGD